MPTEKMGSPWFSGKAPEGWQFGPRFWSAAWGGHSDLSHLKLAVRFGIEHSFGYDGIDICDVMPTEKPLKWPTFQWFQEKMPGDAWQQGA